jgi:hypothetical protein
MADVLLQTSPTFSSTIPTPNLSSHLGFELFQSRLLSTPGQPLVPSLGRLSKARPRLQDDSDIT